MFPAVLGASEQQHKGQRLGKASDFDVIRAADVHCLRLEDPIPEGVLEIRVQAYETAQVSD